MHSMFSRRKEIPSSSPDDGTNGEITYVGGRKVSYDGNYISSIGELKVRYIDGRIKYIGNNEVSYSTEGRIQWVGSQQVTYSDDHIKSIGDDRVDYYRSWNYKL